MFNFLKEYFYYSRNERRGALVLTGFMVLILALPALFGFLQSPVNIDFSAQKSEIAALSVSKSFANNPKDYSSDDTENSNNSPSQLFTFDPNTASKEDFVRLGLSEKVANIIENFRNKGGKFYNKESLKKIYGIRESDYQRLENYIDIDSHKDDYFDKNNKNTEVRPPLHPFNFDPNTATKEDFLRMGFTNKVSDVIVNFRSKGAKFWKKEDFSKIFGISPEDYAVLEPFIQIPPRPAPNAALVADGKQAVMLPAPASEPAKAVVLSGVDVNKSEKLVWLNLNLDKNLVYKIINQREKLGGFTNLNQLKEEPINMPDSIYSRIKSQLKESVILKKLNINTASEAELSKHPYIGNKKAGAIVAFRTNHGAFKNVEELKQMQFATTDWLLKTAAYFEF